MDQTPILCASYLRKLTTINEKRSLTFANDLLNSVPQAGLETTRNFFSADIQHLKIIQTYFGTESLADFWQKKNPEKCI